jgi:hypothetical protein
MRLGRIVGEMFAYPIAFEVLHIHWFAVEQNRKQHTDAATRCEESWVCGFCTQ